MMRNKDMEYFTTLGVCATNLYCVTLVLTKNDVSVPKRRDPLLDHLVG